MTSGDDSGPSRGDVAGLVEVLDVRPDGEGGYDTVATAVVDDHRTVVEGSLLLGQSIVAAGRHAPGRRVVSAHLVFPRAADATRPVRVAVEEVSSGRTFTVLSVRIEQGARVCAVGTLLLDATAADVVRHAAPAPEVVGPDDAVPVDLSVNGREVRVVDDAYTNDSDAPVGPPVIDAWVRIDEVPDDQPIHAGLLAQFTGNMSLAAAFRPHEGVGQAEAHRTISTAINAIAISFHAEVRADQWMLYHHLSTVAGDGMTHSECRVHDQDGALVASFTVDAMLRPLARRPGDHRTVF